jgi:hypothetical protein
MYKMNLNMQTLFGPLDKSYCDYFYYLEITFFVVFLFMAGVAVKTVVTKKKCDPLHLFLVVLQPLMMYFVNRLYYSMCVGSLK